MRRNRRFGPRRGLRFANGRRGVSPPANFVGSGPITRTRPGDESDARSIVLGGDAMTSTTQPVAPFEPFSPVVSSSSLALQTSVLRSRSYESRKLDSILLGKRATSVDTTPFGSTRVIDVNPTGSFIRPSWTGESVGLNRSFVAVSLSSSRHESIAFNTFVSGTEAIESSPVQAFTTLNYSKETRLRRVMVKKTASVADTVPVSGVWRARSFVAASGALFNRITGVFDPHANDPSNAFGGPQSNPYSPCSILIPVNESGKIVDIKVWFEYVALSGGFLQNPLAALGVALRCPNLSWGNAHPIRNDERLKRVYKSTNGDFTPFGSAIFDKNFMGTDGVINPFYRDTFILWESPGVFSKVFDLDDLDSNAYANMYACWHTDFGMRTVFADSAKCPNPRHLNGPRGGNFIGSPGNAKGSTSPLGNHVPWTSDPTAAPAAHALTGSPPPGWLTGPGGVAAVNEWPTTGVNYGTSEIRPLYPLLDGIFQVKEETNEALPVTNSTTQALYTPSLWKGFRPGLRGVEISGTWELLLVAGGEDTGPLAPSSYFRQVRLEFLVETPSYTRFSRRSDTRRAAVRPGERRILMTSGSDRAIITGTPLNNAGWDFGLMHTIVDVEEENGIGRMFSILPLSGNVGANSALSYRLTGALADIVGSETPSWLFSGPGGMPVIPESSASLVPLIREEIVSMRFSEFLEPRRDFDFSQRLSDAAADANPQLRLRDISALFVSASST